MDYTLLSLPLPPPLRSCERALFLSLCCMQARSSTLFSSPLWVGMPSCFEDGFSCYLLNKIEL